MTSAEQAPQNSIETFNMSEDILNDVALDDEYGSKTFDALNALDSNFRLFESKINTLNDEKDQVNSVIKQLYTLQIEEQRLRNWSEYWESIQTIMNELEWYSREISNAINYFNDSIKEWDWKSNFSMWIESALPVWALPNILHDMDKRIKKFNGYVEKAIWYNPKIIEMTSKIETLLIIQERDDYKRQNESLRRENSELHAKDMGLTPTESQKDISNQSTWTDEEKVDLPNFPEYVTEEPEPPETPMPQQ